MTGRVKHSASKPEAARPTPPPPAAVREFDGETGLPVEKPAPVVVLDRETLKRALERISHGRLCGCRGDHDPEQYECPRTIARRALEEA